MDFTNKQNLNLVFGLRYAIPYQCDPDYGVFTYNRTAGVQIRHSINKIGSCIRAYENSIFKYRTKVDAMSSRQHSTSTIDTMMDKKDIDYRGYVYRKDTV